ncbi:MAG: lipid A phosphoethanolamine transferase [Paludibacteraceae bacterium]|nr:lipid A phosphoethanolamine transferase [Paludibacteraceae bacterium]
MSRNRFLSAEYVWLVTVVAVWNTLCFVLPDFFDNPADGWKGVLAIAFYVTALAVGQFAIAAVLSLNRYVAAVCLPLYGMLGAVVSYYRVAFHATVNPVLVDATLHTNMGTVSGVVSWQLAAWFVLQLAVSLLWVRWRWRIGRIPFPWAVLLVSVGLFALWFWGNGRLHRSAGQRYPVLVVRSVAEYVVLQRTRNLPRELPEVRLVHPVDSLDIVMIIGEAARADHLSLNGYGRQTCPRLSGRANVVSLPHIWSQHTHTASSVPHILTPADSLSPEKAYSMCSFISCLSRQGYHTAWVSNQDYGRTYASFIYEADTVVFPNASKTVFVFHPWYDLDLLPPLRGLLRQQPGAHRLYVLHAIGSHWYYNNHVPDSCGRFLPTVTNRVFAQNDSMALVNSYDNTIVSMDLFVDSVISLFADRNAVLFYLSDHGESLGEDGNWLHAAGAEETRYPAALVWYSDRYAQLFPDKVAALEANCTKRYRTDYLFPSLLSAAGLRVEGADAENDLFRHE